MAGRLRSLDLVMSAFSVWMLQYQWWLMCWGLVPRRKSHLYLVKKENHGA